MVDTLALGASGGNPVEVQVLSRAPDIFMLIISVSRAGIMKKEGEGKEPLLKQLPIPAILL